MAHEVSKAQLAILANVDLKAYKVVSVDKVLKEIADLKALKVRVAHWVLLDRTDQ